MESNAVIDAGLDNGKWARLEENRLQEKSKINNQQLPEFPSSWNSFPSISSLTAFGDASIYDYLISSCVLIDDYSDDDSVHEMDENCNSLNVVTDYSTSKPLKRGQLYVDSGHVQELFDGMTTDLFYCVKCKVRASYTPGKLYHVLVMINPKTGKVIRGKCDCKASAMGRCSHVSASLHYILRFHFETTDNVACTSQLCKWNQGRKKKEPQKVDAQKYQNKRFSSEKKNFDPGQTSQRSTDFQAIYKFKDQLEAVNAKNNTKSM